MAGLLINIDVPDIAAAEAFYCAAFGVAVGRRLGDDFVELTGLEAPLYLLRKAPGTAYAPGNAGRRGYERHWTPVHPDIAVDDLDAATQLALAAGARLETAACEVPYGRIAMFADPFGHGFCLIQFNAEGYDAIAT